MLLKQIKYFRAVVRRGGFLKAAEECGTTQQDVVKQVQNLEKELGIQLFSRQSKKIALTKAGEFFYRRTSTVIPELEKICRDAVRISRESGEALNIGYMKCLNGEEFLSAVEAFKEKYPDVALNVFEGSADELNDGLRVGRVDMIIGDVRGENGIEFAGLRLAETTCCVEASANNPLSALDTVDISEIKKLPCIIVASKHNKEAELRYYRDTVGFEGHFLFAETLQLARIMVVANKGIMPIDSVKRDVPALPGVCRVNVVKNGEPVKRAYGALWRNDNASVYVKKFASILKDALTV